MRENCSFHKIDIVELWWNEYLVLQHVQIHSPFYHTKFDDLVKKWSSLNVENHQNSIELN